MGYARLVPMTLQPFLRFGQLLVHLGIQRLSKCIFIKGLARIRPIKVASAVRVPKQVDDIITSRCSMCHAAEPVQLGIAIAPKGVRLDTAAEIAHNAPAIHVQAVLTNAMPPNNLTGMTTGERRVLAQWIAGK